MALRRRRVVACGSAVLAMVVLLACLVCAGSAGVGPRSRIEERVVDGVSGGSGDAADEAPGASAGGVKPRGEGSGPGGIGREPGGAAPEVSADGAGQSGDRASGDGPSESHDEGSGAHGDGLSAGAAGVPEELAQIGAALAGGATTSEQEGSVEEVATRLLASYRDQGDCVLASSGYLDLLGSVWSCVVRGGQWADVCIVSGDEDAGRCQLIVLRMGQDEVAQLLGDES